MARPDAASFRAFSVALLLAAAWARSPDARADGSPPPAGVAETVSHFEYFVLANCSPCVRELYLVGTVSAPAMNSPAFAGVGRASAAGATTRPGEMRFEVLRAYPAGQESRQRFAMRVVLGVSAGAEATLYPLGSGLLDEEEIPVLADALSRWSNTSFGAPGDASLQMVDAEFHADSVRMGALRTGNESFAYVQVAQGDTARFGMKQVWELPAMYLPARDMTLLEQAVQKVQAKIRALRGR